MNFICSPMLTKIYTEISQPQTIKSNNRYPTLRYLRSCLYMYYLQQCEYWMTIVVLCDAPLSNTRHFSGCLIVVYFWNEKENQMRALHMISIQLKLNSSRLIITYSRLQNLVYPQNLLSTSYLYILRLGWYLSCVMCYTNFRVVLHLFMSFLCVNAMIIIWVSVLTIGVRDRYKP